jgi:hypothetical protein
MPVGNFSSPHTRVVAAPRRGLSAMYRSPAVLSALDFVASIALPIPDKPVDEQGVALNPKLPPDITKLSNDALGRLYGQFTAVAQYAEAHASLTDIESTDEEYVYEIGEAREGLSVEGENKEKRVFALRLSQLVQDKKQKALAKRARKVLVAGLLRGYEKAIAALSREQSRRQAELQKNM